MGRPPLEIGTHGNIRLSPLPETSRSAARWCAIAHFRDQSGRTKLIKRVGATQEDAIRALKAGVAEESKKFSGIALAGARVRVSRPHSVAPPRLHALYRFYGMEGNLLYVGLTMDPLTRFKDHATDKGWWREVVRIEIEDHPDYETARAAEKTAIKDEAPAYNIAA